MKLPLPWKPLRAHEDYSGPLFDIEPAEQAEYAARPFVKIEAADGSTVCTAHDLFTFAPGVADHIVRCVNAHDALVQALRVILAGSEISGLWLDSIGNECEQTEEGAEWHPYDLDEQGGWIATVADKARAALAVAEAPPQPSPSGSASHLPIDTNGAGA